MENYKQTPEYCNQLADTLAMLARKSGKPRSGYFDTDMKNTLKNIVCAMNSGNDINFVRKGIKELGRYGYDLLMSESGQNILRTAEQMASGALDGLSLGWADEIEGAASALGYGLASLNPNWNKSGESFVDAMKRGYTWGRDNRRQALANGLNENPALVSPMQFIGAMSAPVGHTNIMGNLPYLNKVGQAMQNPIVSGTVAGLGTAEGNWQNQLGNTAWGEINGFVSNMAAKPLSNHISHTPRNYPNGNVVHNLAQPFFYTAIDKGVHQISNQFDY